MFKIELISTRQLVMFYQVKLQV